MRKPDKKDAWLSESSDPQTGSSKVYSIDDQIYLTFHDDDTTINA
jgi:hypothetical protein